MSGLRLCIFAGAMIVGLASVAHRGGGTATANEPIADRTADLAAGLNAITPRDLGPSSTLRGVKADGNMLVFDVFTHARTLDGFSSADLSKMATAMLCRKPEMRDFVARGGSMAFDIEAYGGERGRATVSDCPAA